MDKSYYKKRINYVIDFIDENINKKLTLNELAETASFSKYHFHRIFKIIIGETLNDYIKRVKMEKIYRQMLIEKNRSLTEIAFAFGYNSSANFSRDFNNYFKVSPSEIRKLKKLPAARKISFTKDLNIPFIGIENISDKLLLYERITTGYNPAVISKVFKDLFEYFVKDYPDTSIEQFIGIGYDDPDYTPPGKCRYDACVSVDKKTALPKNHPYNVKLFKGGNYAVFLFEGKPEQFFPAWDIIFHNWLINSRYIPDNRPHLEMYLPSDKYELGIYKAHLCLPVKKQ